MIRSHVAIGEALRPTVIPSNDEMHLGRRHYVAGRIDFFFFFLFVIDFLYLCF